MRSTNGRGLDADALIEEHGAAFFGRLVPYTGRPAAMAQVRDTAYRVIHTLGDIDWHWRSWEWAGVLEVQDAGTRSAGSKAEVCRLAYNERSDLLEDPGLRPYRSHFVFEEGGSAWLTDHGPDAADLALEGLEWPPLPADGEGLIARTRHVDYTWLDLETASETVVPRAWHPTPPDCLVPTYDPRGGRHDWRPAPGPDVSADTRRECCADCGRYRIAAPWDGTVHGPRATVSFREADAESRAWRDRLRTAERDADLPPAFSEKTSRDGW